MKTYTLKLKTTSTVDYNLYDGTALVSDTDLSALFATAGEAYFVFDFNSLTPANVTAINILDSNSTVVIANTNLTGIAEDKNFKGSWSANATAFDSFVVLTGVAMDEAQLSKLASIAKSKATVITSADYNWNSTDPSDTDPAHFNKVATWKLPTGVYKTSGVVNVQIGSTGIGYGTNTTGIFMVAHSGNFSITLYPTWNKGFITCVMEGSNTSTSKEYGSVVDSFFSTSSTAALSAGKGKELHDTITPATGSSAPTTSTVGTVGKIYIDTSTQTAYMCVAVSGSTYTWKAVTA